MIYYRKGGFINPLKWFKRKQPDTKKKPDTELVSIKKASTKNILAKKSIIYDEDSIKEVNILIYNQTSVLNSNYLNKMVQKLGVANSVLLLIENILGTKNIGKINNNTVINITPEKFYWAISLFVLFGVNPIIKQTYKLKWLPNVINYLFYKNNDENLKQSIREFLNLISHSKYDKLNYKNIKISVTSIENTNINKIVESFIVKLKDGLFSSIRNSNNNTLSSLINSSEINKNLLLVIKCQNKEKIKELLLTVNLLDKNIEDKVKNICDTKTQKKLPKQTSKKTIKAIKASNLFSNDSNSFKSAVSSIGENNKSKPKSSSSMYINAIEPVNPKSKMSYVIDIVKNKNYIDLYNKTVVGTCKRITKNVSEYLRRLKNFTKKQTQQCYDNILGNKIVQNTINAYNVVLVYNDKINQYINRDNLLYFIGNLWDCYNSMEYIYKNMDTKAVLSESIKFSKFVIFMCLSFKQINADMMHINQLLTLNEKIYYVLKNVLQIKLFDLPRDVNVPDLKDIERLFDNYKTNDRCLLYYKTNRYQPLKNIIKLLLSIHIQSFIPLLNESLDISKTSLSKNFNNFINYLPFLDSIIENNNNGPANLFAMFAKKLLINPEISDLEIIFELIVYFLIEDSTKQNLVNQINTVLDLIRILYHYLKNDKETVTTLYGKLTLNIGYRDKSFDFAKILKILSETTGELRVVKDLIAKHLNPEDLNVLDENIFSHFKIKDKYYPINIQFVLSKMLKKYMSELSFIHFGSLGDLINQCYENNNPEKIQNGGAFEPISTSIALHVSSHFFGFIKDKIIKSVKQKLNINEYELKSHDANTNLEIIFKPCKENESGTKNKTCGWEEYGKNINKQEKYKTLYDIIENKDGSTKFLSMFLSTIFIKGSTKYPFTNDDVLHIQSLINPIFKILLNRECTTKKYTSEEKENIEKDLYNNGILGKIFDGVKYIFGYKTDSEKLIEKILDAPTPNQDDIKKLNLDNNTVTQLIISFFTKKLLKLCFDLQNNTLHFENTALGVIDSYLDYINLDSILLKVLYGLSSVTQTLTNTSFSKGKILQLVRNKILLQIAKFNLKNLKNLYFSTFIDNLMEYVGSKDELTDEQKKAVKMNLLKVMKKVSMYALNSDNRILNDEINVDYYDETKFLSLTYSFKNNLKKMETDINEWIHTWSSNHIEANKSNKILEEHKKILFIYKFCVNSQILQDMFDFKIERFGNIICEETNGIY